MSSSPDPAQAALDFLKGKENPFASLARPQRLDDYFLDLHVPELLARERRQLWQIIDHFRVTEYARTSDLPPTAVITILGERGAGKTHLLQSISYREDGKSQILVRPGFFNTQLPVEEYLLAQLVPALLAIDEVYGSRPIEDLAAALTRRLLRQTLRALGPTDRLFTLAPSRWQRWRLLVGGGERMGAEFDRLAEVLHDGPADLLHLIKRHGLDPAQCFRLLCGHLNHFDKGPELLPLLRRELYTAMARAALLGNNEPLFRLLEGEYTQLGGESGARGEIVNRLLHAITEVCALVRQPIVFAFDNLERLFSPQNQFDENLVRVFWSNLAQAIDNTKGLLILLFVETGLFQRASSMMDEFAQARIRQGVPVYGQGPVDRITLNPPAPDEVRVLVKTRIGRLLGDRPEYAGLPAGFPFPQGFLDREISVSQNLRITLSRLRDGYTRHVYEQTPAAASAPAINWESLLETSWNAQLAEASRKFPGSFAGQRAGLHAGLGGLLERLLPLDMEGWQLTDVMPTASIGDNPTYGLVTVLTWRRPSGASESNGTSLKMGVGFLLAQGTGMPPDLRAKFDFFRRPSAGDRLLILWCPQRDGDDLVEILPERTRSVWDGSRSKKKTTLRRVTMNDLRSLLVFPQWQNALAGLADQPPPPQTVRQFCEQHLQPLMQLVAPPSLTDERTAANED